MKDHLTLTWWPSQYGPGVFADVSGCGRFFIKPTTAGHVLKLNSQPCGTFATVEAAKACAEAAAPRMLAAKADAAGIT